MEVTKGALGLLLRKKPYSHFDQIPRGRASKEITQGALVIEGGAFRGLYNQGVLDALMVHNINFQTTIGVSAGALAGLNYVSGQIGRSARTNIKYRHNSNYIGLRAFEKSKSPLNIDFLFEDIGKIDPIDKQRFMDPRKRFVVVATDCRTGKPRYFEKGKCKDFKEAIKASASMPFLSPMIEVEGAQCLDGGCSCKIPYGWAIDQGYEKIVIIKTRERGFRKPIKNRRRIIERFYGDFPQFVKLLCQSIEEYNRECEQVDQLEKSGRCFVIAPSQPVGVRRLEPDVEKLGRLYWLGYYDALNSLDALKAYLSQ